jgi:hypothetical protein
MVNFVSMLGIGVAQVMPTSQEISQWIAMNLELSFLCREGAQVMNFASVRFCFAPSGWGARSCPNNKTTLLAQALFDQPL